MSSRTLRSIPLWLALAVFALWLPATAAAVAPAVTGIAVSPDPPTAGQQATYTATVTGAPDTVAWSFDDGTSLNSSDPVSHTFASAGQHSVTVTATNTDGSGSQSLNVDVNAPPTVDFMFNPLTPIPGQVVLFANNSSDPDNQPLTFAWNFGDGTTATDRNPTHAYLTPGTKSVRLTATDPAGASDEVVHNVTVIDPSAPRAAFGFSPAAPVAGQRITFTSSVQASAGQRITALNWDLDSDGQFDDAKGATATHVFDSSGVYRIALEALQSNGTRSVAEGTVRVAARPGIIRPAIVHLRALVLSYGARVKILGVRAPRGTLVSVRCGGRGCPTKLRRHHVGKSHRVNFPAFQRTLRAGIRLEIFIRKSGTIGVYTRYTIRAGKGPKRSDACLMPNKSKPVRCPS